MAKSQPYPVFLDLAGGGGRPVLIVGGGGVALRKARGVLESGGRVTVIAPRIDPELARLRAVRKVRRAYRSTDMANKPWRLVFAATDASRVNERVQRDAAKKRILCCRCDEPQLADFSNGATASAGGVVMALSTSGASPVLARRIRDQAHAAIDPVLARLAGLLETWRAGVKQRVDDPMARRSLLMKLAGDEMEAALRSGGAAAANRLFARWLREAPSNPGQRRTPTRSRNHD